MNIKKLNEDQAANWEYLPDTNTLLQYINRVDLIELSMCCRLYRDQLEQRVLENFDLSTWKRYNRDIYEKLRETCKIEKILKFLKLDLGSKLKFIKKATLKPNTQVPFAKEFNILLPKIKTLILHGDYYDNSVGLGLITILKGMKSLEIVKLNNIWGPIEDFNTKRKIFPNSIKSLIICDKREYIFIEGISTIYDNIDDYYTNLYSLSVVTNRMLKNLSCGMPNLREVEIKEANSLKLSNITSFLKSNPQLEKLITDFNYYNEEILQVILSFKYLRRWVIRYGHWEGVKVYNLPSNYSIKYLKFHGSIPAPLTYQFINACKNIETLELKRYFKLNYLNWSKFEREIPILKINYENFNCKTAKAINNSKKFNVIHVERNCYIDKRINNYRMEILNNYKIFSSNAKFYALKLIN